MHVTSAGYTGIGTTTPGYALTVQSASNTALFSDSVAKNFLEINPASGDMLELHDSWATGLTEYVHQDSASGAPGVSLYKSRGTYGLPTAVQWCGSYECGDYLGYINFGGYDGSSYGLGAAIYASADENWTPASHESHLAIYFTKHGQTTQNEMVQFGGKDGENNNGSNVLFFWPLNFYENSTKGAHLYSTGNGDLVVTRGDGSAGINLDVLGSEGIGTTTPVANFQVANGNATTTVEFGSAGQSKGTCIKLYRTDGSAIYASVAAGATTFTLTTTPCASVTGF